MNKYRVAFLIGTRPEVVKVAPVLHAVNASARMAADTIITGQHREMVDGLLDYFAISPTIDLDLMQPRQSLSELTARAIGAVSTALRNLRPSAIVVQGDTTTAFASALAAFYERIPVVHLEAGLRTRDLNSPYPEEANRQLIGRLTELHLAPTASAAENLIAEGISKERIIVTGNTVIDSLLSYKSDCWLSDDLRSIDLHDRRLLLVTAHRRESWGEPLRQVAAAVRRLADEFPSLTVILPLHRNPVVRQSLVPLLQGHEHIHLVEPADYPDFVRLLRSACVVLTDSGGVQEEAPSLGRPVLVLRNTTERPEGVAAGTARLVGTDTTAVVNAVRQLLLDEHLYQKMATAVNPYGDGRAAERAASALAHLFGLGPRPADFTAIPE